MTRNSSRYALVLSVLVLASSGALAQPATVPVNETNSIARPLLIVSPKYPKDAPPEKKRVEVQVKGKVTTQGNFASAVYSSREGDEVFVQALRDVLEMWRFIPAIDSQECKAKEHDATVFVWFDMNEDGPSISASMPPKKPGPASAEERKAPRKPLKYAPRKGPYIDYPLRALRAGIEGTTMVLLKVKKSGEVETINILAYSPSDVFNEEVLSGLRELRYEPFDPLVYGRDSEAICAEVTVQFCMREASVSIPNPQCPYRQKQPGFKRGSTLNWKTFP